MKFTKRITSMLLIFVFAFTSMYMVAPAANFSDVAEEYAHYEAITALVDQGIINGYEDGTFKPENTITRAEFSKLLAVSSAPTGYAFSATTTNFPDIADMNAAHGWAVPYISYAVSTKAINGYTDGTFQPGNPVTYGEAIKMIVCTLGYGPVADTTLTPWYQGYLNIANQIGLTKNAAAVGDAPANRGIVAHLIYNMLDCPVLTQTGVDALGNPIYSTATGDGSSFGDSKDNAKSAEGVVMGVTDYSLDATAVGRNKVQIDNEIFSLGSKLDMDTVKSYIGYRVQYSYSGSAGKQEITKITRLNGYNSSVTIEPWQIANITSNYIEYFENERAEAQGDVTRVTYGSRPYVIYNSVPVNPADIGAGFNVASYFDVETGSITLFSNDSNEKTAELVIVESYKTYLVYTSPSVADGVTTIYDKNAAYTGLQALAIAEEDVSSVKKVSAKGATPTSSTIGAIVSKTVVSVAVPYGTTEGTNVMVSSAYATGDVTELSSDYETIVIGSQSYELSPYYRTLLANNCPEAGFTNGDNVKIYFDYLGRIVYSEKNETADPYGLLIAYADGGSMDSVASLGIMTTGSKFLEHQMKSTIKVNGVSMNSDQAIESLKASALISDGNYIIQPVKYRTSGNLFTSIEVLTAASAQETLKYTTSGPAFKSGSATKFGMTTSGSKATVVFVVPEDITKIDKYSKKSATYFNDGSPYSVVPYEMEGSSAKVVLCHLTSTSVVGARIGASTPVYLIDSVTDYMNGDDIVKKVTYRNIATTDEAKVAYSSDEAEVISKFESIQPGDIVKFVTEDGVVVDIQKVYSQGVLASASPIGTVIGGNPNHIGLSGDNITNYFQAIVGTIEEVEDGGTSISIIPELYANSALDEEKRIILSRSKTDIPVYEWKTDGTGSRFSPLSVSALVKYADFKATEPSLATKALVIVMNNKVVGIYVID